MRVLGGIHSIACRMSFWSSEYGEIFAGKWSTSEYDDENGLYAVASSGSTGTSDYH